MKRIALFISSLQKGGSERVMVNLAEYFHKNRYEVILVTQYKQDVEYDISPEIRRVYSEPEEHELQGGRIHNFCVRFAKLRNIWKAYKPDIILAFLGKNNLMAIATSMFLPSKVAVSVRGEPTMEYEGKLMQFLAKAMFGLADGVILQTEMAKLFFPKWVQKKAKILPNPMNLNFLNKRFIGTREDKIVAVGRLDENKNHAMLIHAFGRIVSEYPKMKLVIYGEGDSREQLEQMVAEKGLEEKIELPGSITDVEEHIKAARIFTLTSNTEGMPNSLMEAMALGLPVVSTDCPCGGPATLIENDVNGILVPVGDAYALADAFRKILSNQEYAEKMGENAYEITKKLNPDTVNREWEQYLLHIAK
ncbi:MAG: glycosyltransferase [Lachnospiraceae bacterium]|nr:glycosyltransferase [Lachnospiraceae bacterium]